MLWYSLEVPQRGASNEYPQHMFSSRNKKDISIFSDEKSALSVAMGNFKNSEGHGNVRESSNLSEKFEIF